MDPRLKKLLKYGTSYANATTLLAPVGTPSEFFNNTYFSEHGWWKEEAYNWWKEELNWKDLMGRDQARRLAVDGIGVRRDLLDGSK